MLRENNLIAYTIPEIPLSRLQKYQITEEGLSILKQYVPRLSHDEARVEARVKGPVEARVRGPVEARVELNKSQITILSGCVHDSMSTKEIMQLLGHSTPSGSIRKAISELMDNNLIAYTIPEKPKSRLQKYQITEAGLSILKQYTGEGEDDN